MEASPERILRLLRHGEIDVLGVMPGASNYTFAVRVTDGPVRGAAVYKPADGETPLWDFPEHTLYRREIAAYEVAEALGWSFVPPTVAREEGPYGAGSLQLLIDADFEQHYFTLLEQDEDLFRRVAAFDIVVNNADRKSGHCLLERETGRIWMIDHGVCFHHEPKLRTVIWEFVGEPLPHDVVGALRALENDVSSDSVLKRRLAVLLSEHEVAAMRERIERLLAGGVFPEPPPDRRHYPWPPV